ncbi:MAG: diaminohydroxyphosphoribosylaminopyrimidine deaminase [Acidobacteria bacterium]|nr:diaminohydroxyphosphoribosylaminopyrimidine deaminase [Acidobacteriota bacterium]
MSDEQFMRRALELAEEGRTSVSPNPMVGCVIVRDGDVVAEGWHRRAGEAHAEIEALTRCDDPRGTTVYVTLEPCAHQGRTGPCAEALVAAGPARVVVAMRDPFALVDGRGLDLLRAAGIEIEVGLLEDEARRLNERFLWNVTQKLPFVLLKAAMTLDGKLATVARESRWITGSAARERSLLLREEYDGILVGGGTVAADDPRLTRRLGLNSAVSPWTRVVLDGAGQVPPAAQLLVDGGRTILVTSRPERYEQREGVEVIAIAEETDLEQLLRELYRRGVTSLIAEGGSLLHSQLIRRGLWQKMVLFIAPMLVGGGEAPAILGGSGIARLTEAHRFRFDRAERVGEDLMVVAYPA